MRVMVLGVRGIPEVQGGVETHAEQLYPRLKRLGCEIEVVVRSPFVPPSQREFDSIPLRRIWCPRQPGLEAFVHSVLGVIYAGFAHPDILHVHAIGPSIITPIARLFGLRVVVTHHGPDYDRAKWGPFARWVLRTGERWGMRYAHARIAVSNVIAELISSKHRVAAVVIPNGALAVDQERGTKHIEALGLQPGRYFLQVSRVVPEKRQLDLIAAFLKAQVPDWKLVLVGGLDSTAYSGEVRAAAGAAGAVLTGFLTGAPLREIYSHAGGFVLPSAHEGLPIAILEALSYGLPVVASAIPANLEVGLPATSYFPLGDVGALSERLQALVFARNDESERAARRAFVTDTYDWDRIAGQTLAVYQAVMAR